MEEDEEQAWREAQMRNAAFQLRLNARHFKPGGSSLETPAPNPGGTRGDAKATAQIDWWWDRQGLAFAWQRVAPPVTCPDCHELAVNLLGEFAPPLELAAGPCPSCPMLVTMWSVAMECWHQISYQNLHRLRVARDHGRSGAHADRAPPISYERALVRVLVEPGADNRPKYGVWHRLQGLVGKRVDTEKGRLRIEGADDDLAIVVHGCAEVRIERKSDAFKYAVRRERKRVDG